jgi:hypothetical protein
MTRETEETKKRSTKILPAVMFMEIPSRPKKTGHKNSLHDIFSVLKIAKIMISGNFTSDKLR